MMLVKQHYGDSGSYRVIDTATGESVGANMYRPITVAGQAAPTSTVEDFISESDKKGNPLQTTPDWNTGGRKDPETSTEESDKTQWYLIALAVGAFMLWGK